MTKVFAKNLVITGKPGSGKTTLLREALLPFKAKAGGFITEELREGDQRLGFKLTDLEGRSGVLASKTLAGPPKINKYGIDLKVLDGIGVSALKAALENHRIAVIDEIGSMEAVSEPFRTVVMEALQGPRPVLATIRKDAQPFTDTIRQMKDTEVLELGKENFAERRAQVRAWLAWAAAQ